MTELKQQAKRLAEEFIAGAKLKKGQVAVIGCSTSEIGGSKIGSNSSLDIAKEVFSGLYEVFSEKGIFLAVQCCEHLNRAIITERVVIKDDSLIVNAVPQLHAGGAFAMTAYATFRDPVVVEHIKADGGIDIGSTLIGMHIKDVCVPLRVSVRYIGEAYVVCARRRPKYIGGERAKYDPDLM